MDASFDDGCSESLLVDDATPAALTRITDGLTLRNSASPMSPTVSGVFGR